MKIDFSIFLMLFLVLGVTAYPKQSLIVKGKITGLEIQKIKESSVSLGFGVQMILRNAGTKPIIFFNKEGFPKFNAVSIFANKEELDRGNPLAASYYGDSVDSSEKWLILRKNINVSAPPDNLLYILKPNSEWIIETKLFLHFPTEKYKSSNFPKKESWEHIRQLNSVWVTFFADSWALNLEKDRTTLKLAKKLQNRWTKFGYLWIDEIASDPLQIDLSTF